jgi:hypothetical protein
VSLRSGVENQVIKVSVLTGVSAVACYRVFVMIADGIAVALLRNLRGKLKQSLLFSCFRLLRPL